MSECKCKKIPHKELTYAHFIFKINPTCFGNPKDWDVKSEWCDNMDHSSDCVHCGNEENENGDCAGCGYAPEMCQVCVCCGGCDYADEFVETKYGLMCSESVSCGSKRNGCSEHFELVTDEDWDGVEPRIRDCDHYFVKENIKFGVRRKPSKIWRNRNEKLHI